MSTNVEMLKRYENIKYENGIYKTLYAIDKCKLLLIIMRPDNCLGLLGSTTKALAKDHIIKYTSDRNTSDIIIYDEDFFHGSP